MARTSRGEPLCISKVEEGVKDITAFKNPIHDLFTRGKYSTSHLFHIPSLVIVDSSECLGTKPKHKIYLSDEVKCITPLSHHW